MCYLIVLFCFNSELRDLNFFDKNLKNQTKKRDIDGWNSHQWASKHIFIQSFNFIFINPFKNYYPPFKFFKKKKNRVDALNFQFKNQVKKRAKKDRRSINRAHINKKYRKSSINWNQSYWFQLIFVEGDVLWTSVDFHRLWGTWWSTPMAHHAPPPYILLGECPATSCVHGWSSMTHGPTGWAAGVNQQLPCRLRRTQACMRLLPPSSTTANAAGWASI